VSGETPFWRTVRDRKVRRGSEMPVTAIIVDPDTNRVVRDKIDMAGNDLSAVLVWCATHGQAVWQYRDGSFTCPHTLIVEWDTEDHVIVAPPWEAL